VRYVLIIGLTIFRSIGHEHNVLNKGNSERKVVLKKEQTHRIRRERGWHKAKKKDGEQNLETWHTEPAVGVEPATRKSKGKNKNERMQQQKHKKEKVALD
jgi:hypothetical protein